MQQQVRKLVCREHFRQKSLPDWKDLNSATTLQSLLSPPSLLSPLLPPSLIPPQSQHSPLSPLSRPTGQPWLTLMVIHLMSKRLKHQRWRLDYSRCLTTHGLLHQSNLELNWQKFYSLTMSLPTARWWEGRWMVKSGSHWTLGSCAWLTASSSTSVGWERQSFQASGVGSGMPLQYAVNICVLR